MQVSYANFEDILGSEREEGHKGRGAKVQTRIPLRKHEQVFITIVNICHRSATYVSAHP